MSIIMSLPKTYGLPKTDRQRLTCTGFADTTKTLKL